MPLIQQNYTISELAPNGTDVLTLKVATNTGTDTFENGTENTCTIEASVNDLSVLNLVAAGAGNSISDASLNGVSVSYVEINGGAKKFDSLSKPVPGTTLTFTDATTLVMSDTVDVYYLDDGDGDTLVSGIRRKDLAARVASIWAGLQTEAASIPDPDIYAAMIAAGLRWDE